jgi:phosphatidate cytidylyltransferase
VAGSRKDREEGSEEDLFEDLDEFFAPLEEWPEGEAPPEDQPPSAEPPQEVDTDAVEAVEGDLEGLEIDIPDEDELVPEAGPAGLGARTTEPPAVEPEGEPPPSVPGEVSLSDLELGDEKLGGEPESEGWEAGAEQDWEAAAASELVESAGAEEGGPAPEGERAAGDEPPVTIDDLKAPPPQYVELPGPEDEQPVLEEEASFLGELEGDVPAEPGAPEEEEVTARIDQPEVPEEEAAAAEAAADHFAEGIPPEEIERELLADLEQSRSQTVQIPGEGATGVEPVSPEQPPAEVEPEEGVTAPTWQEEGAQPVAAEEPEPAAPARGLPAGRNLVAAFASGIVLAAAVIILLYIGKGPFAVFAGIVILAGQAEFYAVMRARGYKPATLLGLVAGAFIVAGAYLRGDAAVLFGLFLAMSLGALWYMAGTPASRKETTGNVAVTLLGVVYVPVLASSAMLLLGLPGDLGRNTFLTVVGLTILYDVAAYAVGSWFGSRPLAPTISPSKSREGAIGATVILLFASFAVVPAIDPFTWQTAFGLGLVIAVAAPLGDLVESAFKRDLGVKDMGTILPGHGGILDRIDAILFTAPAAYYFLRIIFF